MARPDASDNGPSPDSLEYRAEVPDTLSGRRLDQALAILFPDSSRSRRQAWIKTGRVTVDGLTRRPWDLVLGGGRHPDRDRAWVRLVLLLHADADRREEAAAWLERARRELPPGAWRDYLEREFSLAPTDRAGGAPEPAGPAPAPGS